MKVGYLGFGNSVQNYHFPFIKKREDKYIVKRICYPKEVRDIDKEKEYSNIVFSSNENDIYHDVEIELVVVCTPNHYHKEQVMKALTHGKHVLVEKPIAFTVEEAKEMFACANKMGKVLMVNQNRRFDADFVSLHEIINSNMLGDIIEVESHYDYFQPNSIIEGVMYLHGLGVHTIDQMISLFGTPKKIVYDVRSVSPTHHSDDYFDIDLFYKGFKVIVKTCYSILKDYPRFMVHGTRGSFIIPAKMHNSSNHEIKNQGCDVGKLYVLNEQGQIIEKEVKQSITDYGKVYDNLYDVIKHGDEKLIKDEEVIEVLKIIEQGLEKLNESRMSD